MQKHPGSFIIKSDISPRQYTTHVANYFNYMGMSLYPESSQYFKFQNDLQIIFLHSFCMRSTILILN